MSGIWLPVSALTISVFLCVIFLIKEKADNIEVVTYSQLLMVNLLFCINALAVYIYAMHDGNLEIISYMQKLHLGLLLCVGHLLLKYNLNINQIDTSSKNITSYFLELAY